MITLRNPLVPDSGDLSEIDTSRLENNTLFWDNSFGLVRWNLQALEWQPVGTSIPIAPTIRTNADLKFDGSEYYLEFDNCNGVMSMLVDGVTTFAWLTKDFTPNRIYGIPNNLPATYILLLS